MSDRKGRWLSYDLRDGTVYTCGNQTQTGTKRVQTTEGRPEAKSYVKEVLEYDKPNKTYRITEAGLRVLELHNKIIEMLKVINWYQTSVIIN